LPDLLGGRFHCGDGTSAYAHRDITTYWQVAVLVCRRQQYESSRNYRLIESLPQAAGCIGFRSMVPGSWGRFSSSLFSGHSTFNF
jgi:hypothetical protein